MSFAAEFRALIRSESDADLRRMAEDDTFLAAIARSELERRERERPTTPSED